MKNVLKFTGLVLLFGSGVLIGYGLKKSTATGVSVTDHSGHSDTLGETSFESPRPSNAGGKAQTLQATGPDATLSLKVITELSQVNPAIVEAVFADLNVDLLSSLVTRLAAEDPEAAIRLIERSEGDAKQQLIFDFTPMWAEKDPLAALLWFESVSVDMPKVETLATFSQILVSMAKVDAAGAIQIAKSLEQQDQADGILHEVITGWGVADPQAALAWLQSAESENLSQVSLNESYKRIMQAYAYHDPAATGVAVASLESRSLQMELTPHVVEAMALRDLTGAKEWVASLPSGESRLAGWGKIAELTLTDSPEATIQFLVETPEFFQAGNEGSIDSILSEVLRTNDAQLYDRFDDFSPEGQVWLAKYFVMDELAVAQNPAEVANWLNALPQGAAYEAGVTSYAESMIHKEPVSALVWAATIKSAGHRHDLFEKIVALADPAALPSLENELASMELTEQEYATLYGLVNQRYREELSPLPVP